MNKSSEQNYRYPNKNKIQNKHKKNCQTCTSCY